LLLQDLEVQHYHLVQETLQVQAVHWVLLDLVDRMFQDLLQDHLSQVNQLDHLVLVVLRCLLFLMDPVAQMVQAGHYHPLNLLILMVLLDPLAQEAPNHPVLLGIH